MNSKVVPAFPLLLVMLLSTPLSGRAQLNVAGQKPLTSLDELVETLKAHKGCSRQVTAEEMAVIAQDGKQIADWIAASTPETLSATLPKFVDRLAGGDDEDKSCARHVLLDVALRPDSAALLRDHVSTIGAVLNSSSDDRIQRGVGAILSLLKPAPPPEAVPPLLAFLARPDRDPDLQAAAVGTLATIGPHDSAVIAAIQEFWSRPLDPQYKQGVLDGLGNSRSRDQRLIAIVTSALQDPNLEIRLTAVGAVGRMGKDAIRQAAPELRNLASKTQTAEEMADPRMLQIRRQAKQILATMEQP